MPRTRSLLAAATIALTCTAGVAEAGKGPNKRHPHKPKPAFPTKKPKLPKLPKLPQMPPTPAADPLDQKLSGKVFELEFTASRSISWKAPKQTVSNCAGTDTVESHGDDEWSARSGSYFVRIVRVGDAYSFVPVERKYHHAANVPIKVFGTWKRSAEITATHAGGWCGDAKPTPVKPPEDDCGARKPRYTLGIVAQRGEGISVSLARAGEDKGFEACAVTRPTGMPDLPGAAQSAAFDPGEILEAKGGGFRFSEDYEGPGQTFGTLEWKISLEERD